jgi:hypothetical protein
LDRGDVLSDDGRQEQPQPVGERMRSGRVQSLTSGGYRLTHKARIAHPVHDGIAILEGLVIEVSGSFEHGTGLGWQFENGLGQ